jgi:hypothetical protein
MIKNPNFSMQDKSQLEKSRSFVSLLVQNAKTTLLLILHSHPSSMIKNPKFSMQDKPQLEPASVVSILVSASFLKVLFNFLKRQYHAFFK